MTTVPLPSARRQELISAALQRWVDALIDLGGRNNLIYYRDLKVGTLDLAEADPPALTQLHSGSPVRLSRLFPPGLGPTTPVNSARKIHDKIRELDEERGIRAGYLAIGMATWTDPEGRRTPNAPVLLRAVALRPVGGAKDDFDIELADEAELNPVLVHLFEALFGTQIDADELASLVDLTAGQDPRPVYEALTKDARQIPGFAIDHREVIGTFTYAKLPMVTDLQANPELLAASDVVAAIAGDPEAGRAARGPLTDAADQPLDLVPPTDEFVVLDADSSQSRTINAVVAGSHLVVKGPPGTGKSQTIANLIATLVARGSKVLFVAEKRAAIEAVLRRLEQVGLNDLVMDLHEGAGQRRRVAQALLRNLDQVRQVPPVAQQALHERLTRTRGQLAGHAARMHTPLGPWDVTLFQAQAAAIGTPAHLAATTRWRNPQLSELTGAIIDEAERTLREFVQLGGIDPRTAASPWAGSFMTTPAEADQALASASRLASDMLPYTRVQLNQVLADTGLQPPANVAEWRDVFTLLDGVAATLAFFDADVFTTDLPTLCAATGSRAYRKERTAAGGFFARRRHAKAARGLCVGDETPSKSALHSALCAALVQRETWTTVRVDDGLPRLPGALGEAQAGYSTLATELQALAAHLATSDLFALDTERLFGRVDELTRDVATLQKMPRLNQLRGWLTSHSLDPVVAEASSRRCDGDAAAALCRDAWYRSLLEQAGISDPGYGAFTGQAQNSVVRDFVQADTDHRDTTPHRVRRAAAEALVVALNRHDDQARLIRTEAGKRMRHKPLRELWRLAPDVLQAVKPCWAMSPLVVSQVLPARNLFDVVIFDEASQVQPADAMPAIMRASRVVVAGDERQLPPTSFFAAATTEDEDPEVVAASQGLEVSLTSGFESILDVLTALLPWQALTWHYRSRDERLIAFSNAHIYDSSLVTFPGVTGEDCLRHVHVPQEIAAPGQEDSVAAEARRVVDLVIDHAERHPKESLGVITMGIKHADRIQNELLTRLAERRDLDEFFAEDRDERFFVKNLERVQGDERDAIILSIGYGKGPHGRMRYRWGPLNNKGGERRLNVAVTRAKTRLTLVSAFTAYDVDPNAIHADGSKMLRAYLEFAASGGAFLGSGLAVAPVLNPFEIDVRDRLVSAGIPVVAQYGVSGYRIDFAAAHPSRLGRMVLAIEADGASYHSAQSARDRDRLRQQHLENLGWTFHRIWSTDWFRDPAAETAKARVAYERAVARADSGPGTPTSQANAPRKTAPPELGAAPHRGPRPGVASGLHITDYTPSQLRQVVRYIVSDGLLRTDEEILREAMAVLGFQKAGSRIRRAFMAAITAEMP